MSMSIAAISINIQRASTGTGSVGWPGAPTTTVVAVTELLFGVGSGTLVEVTDATFVILPVNAGNTRYVAVTVVLAPTGNAASVHGNPLAHGAPADTKVSPAGVGSASTGSGTASGPWLVTTIV